MDFKTLDSIIEQNKDDMIKTLSEWIKLPSVKSEPLPGAPMGKDIGIMLDKAIEDCKAAGFDVRNFDGYALDARMGEIGKDPLAILAHMDVVPTGDNWEKDPFGAEIDNGYIYGRGTQDDKGPAVASLYAMKAVKEAGIKLNREVRLILGTDEESGSECMKYYSEHCDLPRSGFSPDACFPLINTEKSMIRIDVKGKPSKTGLQVIKLYTGERANVIPGKCKAIVAGNKDIIDLVKKYAKELDCQATADIEGDYVTIEVFGIPGHAAMPEGTKNAIGYMLKLLSKLGAEGALYGLAELVGAESDGKSLGVKCHDEISGDLTLNMGIIRIDEDSIETTFDLRTPILSDYKAIFNSISEALSLYGFECKLSSYVPPHHVSEKSELVQKLLRAYREETGDNSTAIAIGGGTYAKILNEGVAFGSIFPGEEELAHQANERASIENLFKNVKIIAKSIVYLCSDNI